MSQMLKFGLIAFAIIYFATTIINSGGLQMPGNGSYRLSAFLLIVAPALIFPTVCVVAANLIDGKPFLPRAVMRRSLQVLAIAAPVAATVHAVGLYRTFTSNSTFSSSMETLGNLYMVATVLRPVVGAVLTSCLALYFAEQVKRIP